MLMRKTGQELLSKVVQSGQGLVAARSFFGRKSKHSSAQYIEKEKCYSAHNYIPIPAVLSRGEGVHVWDAEGKKYLDFLAGFATLNTGHCHPKLVSTLKEQASTLHHTARAFHNDVFPEYAEYVCKYFGYDKVLPMNTGVEGGETAVKIARRWGYTVKKICENKALVVFPEGNFWGRTMSAISTSTNPVMYENFGPFMEGFGLVPYNDLCALEEALKNPNVCAFMMEPIQGEAGVVVPNERYLSEVRRLCTMYNVLWIADEVQTGLGRTGALLACDHECVRPDMAIIGKGLAGGFTPVSAVLANDNVMSVITPGSHGSTFGGNPLGCKLAMKTLEIIKEEKLIENSAILGEKFRTELICRLPKDKVPFIRGKGLMNAIAINPEYGTAWDFCVKLKDNGLLTKPCDGNVVRFTPPLILNDQQLSQGLDIIEKTVNELKKC
ncbi:hypothetical protein AAG570_003305 [Ranatra chinensis]|uniref:Ornithine aminotransferase n=1 Tax=Ranatra chinensis TaxID=642074 RepID=A0ABD0Y6F6_9HEMI